MASTRTPRAGTVPYPRSARAPLPLGMALAATLALGTALSACIEPRCYDGSDCESPKICGPEGLCVFECSADPDCPEGFACASHRCEPRPVHPVVCPPDMTAVAETFCIDVYEASRADATGQSAGSDESVARSVKSVMPWLVADNATADAACAAVGKRLCTATEWELACRGPAGTVYGYGDRYEPATCNGIDAFGRSAFHLEPTGAFPGCTNGWGVFDMNGNVWEHVANGSDMLVRGGAFNCSDSAALHRCDYVPGSWKPSARGFRCCLSPSESPDAGLPAPDAGANNTAIDAGTDGGGCPDEDAGLTPDAGIEDAGVAHDAGTADGGCLDPDAGLPADAGSEDDAGATDAALPEDAGIADGGSEPADAGEPERCPPEMALVGDLCIDRWEASREDATDTDPGTSNVPTSRPGARPWYSSSLMTAEARDACASAGKRLCRADEWVGACGGPAGTAYSYGDQYDPIACNGIDAFCNCSAASCSAVPTCPYPHCFNQPSTDGSGGPCGAAFHPVPTGTFADCTNAYGVFDINGNVWEAVEPVTPDGLEHFRGGAFNCSDSEVLHRCDYDATWMPSARGFRCCRDAT